MSETTRTETQLGIADLTKRFSAAGIAVIAQRINPLPQGSIYFEIGNTERQTDVTLSMNFLDDLPNTKEYQAAVDSYALAVAGRLKCGSPEVFYCRSGVAVRASIRWPMIDSAIYKSVLTTFIPMKVINQVDGQVAKCSMDIGSDIGFISGHTAFDFVMHTVKSMRTAIDESLIKFYSPDVPQEDYQRVKAQEQSERRSQSEIEQFLRGKAYVLGFLAADEPGEVWAADPWDALYLGVTKKELLLAMRVLRANGLLDAGSGPEYARPTDKLLADQSSEKKGEETLFQSQQKVSRLNLPTKDVLLKDMVTILERHSVSALLVIDLDNFKSVNDRLGHSKGEECLDLVVSTIGIVVGRRGKIYRWGTGDEFAVCLPDFSTEEAQVTAERIRRGIEEAKPGGEINVTTSIGVCASDRVESQSAKEILDFADKAMYQSKNLSKNRVTTWPFGADAGQPVPRAAKPTKQAIKAQLAVFLKEGREIQNGLEYSNVDSLRKKQEWEQRVEKYLEKYLDESYAVRFQTPGHPPTTYPEGINSPMMAPWSDTGARMVMLNSFMAELRD